MTSDVMVLRAAGLIVRKTEAVMLKLVGLVVLLLAFSVFTDVLVYKDGYTGFLHLAAREPWGLQMLLDVTIALGLFVSWMIPDARRRGIVAWPYVIACVALGSIGALAYLVHRQLRELRGSAREDGGMIARPRSAE
jgi:hypothetical protein